MVQKAIIEKSKEDWVNKRNKVKVCFEDKERDRLKLEKEVHKDQQDKFRRSALAKDKLVEKRN